MTRGPGDLRDQSEVADKGLIVSSLWSLLSLGSLGLCGLLVSAVTWSLRSLGLSVLIFGTRGPKGPKRSRGQGLIASSQGLCGLLGL